MNFRFEEDITLESGQLLLKPITLEDTGNLLEIATADRYLLQFSPKQVYTEELLTEYVQTAIALRNNQARYTFSIFSKPGNCYVGSTAFLNVSNPDDRLEIGATWLGKQFQGTGLNRECKQLLLQFVFDKLLAHRVEFRTDERNLRSRRAIEKIGGRFEGVLKEHTVMYDGFRRNTFCYRILKEEWLAMQTSNN